MQSSHFCIHAVQSLQSKDQGESAMNWVWVGIGVVLLGGLGWLLNRRFGGEDPETHANMKPPPTHDPKSLVGQGLEGQGIE